MRFGGMQKNSFIDYPGKISCVLFLTGCNFNCPYCHNPDLVQPNKNSVFLKEDEVYGFLEDRKTFLEGVVVSGGEPTLSKDLILLCTKLKKMGYPVKLDTNGTRPHVITHLMKEDLIDYIAMDIKTDLFNYTSLVKKRNNPNKILSSINIIMASNLGYEFRTTCIKPIINEQVIENISHIIKGANLYILQNFNDENKVLNPHFFNKKIGKYTDNQMLKLKIKTKPWVKKCIIR